MLAGTGSIAWPQFCQLVTEKVWAVVKNCTVYSYYSEQARDLDPETHFKDTFRVFSKDEEGEIKLS